MSTMRERLARAAFPEEFSQYDACIKEADDLRYRDGETMSQLQADNLREDASGILRKPYRIVGAMLDVLREPDDAMVQAGRYGGPITGAVVLQDAYRAMIDEVRRRG